jgi:SAM-dependent methyltransferase
MYESGEYFQDPRRHAGDAAFKANSFLSVLERACAAYRVHIDSYADVGSGSGDVTQIVARGLRARGFTLQTARGYDVSPHVRNLQGDGVEFLNADFGQSDDRADLVTLFDVVEHVDRPVDFLRALAERCLVVGLHIPLDDSWNTASRDLFRHKLKNPGHLIFLDPPGALNLLAFAGLRVIDYDYTFGFRTPSGRLGGLARIAAPIRSLLARASPWLLSKTMGGTSLMVVALSPAGVRTLTPRGKTNQ